MSEPFSILQTRTLLNRCRDAAEQVVGHLQSGEYCTLLGPRYSGKTEVVLAVEKILAEQLGWPCVLLDLHEVRASTHQEFFGVLADQTAARISELTGRSVRILDPGEASSAAFRGFLIDAVLELGHDVVLVVDHLEALPNDLVQALLTSLRAAYMEQQMLDHRLLVVASGALSLAALTVGESSPFRGIARRVFISGLSESETEALIDEQIETAWIEVAPAARRRLYEATRGDPNLVWRIYRDAAQRARDRQSAVLDEEAVEETVVRFLSNEVFHYAPLQEAVRTIEEDPDLLRSVLLLLDRDSVPLSELPLPLSPDLDPLRLTGVVEKAPGDRYRLRNEIYRRLLVGHFSPGRVGHLLSTAGQWDSAIDYLAASVNAGSEQSRWDLMTATVNSIYASESVALAARYLLRGLSGAFGITSAQVWYAPVHESSLRLVAYSGGASHSPARIGAEIPVREDCLEARAYREAAVLRGPELGRGVQRVFPLITPGRKPIGVVVLEDRLGGMGFLEQRERDLQITGYLNQAGRAIEQVGRRTLELALAGRIQTSLLPRTIPSLPGWQIAAALKPARLTSGDFYDFIRVPGGKLGIAIADVTDKGMGAALYMALSRTLIRTYATEYPERPEMVMSASSRRMLSDAPAGLFVTVFYAILDPASGILTYCNAGHNPPYLLNSSSRAPLALGRTGMALGVVEDATWTQAVIRVEPGDLLVLYTDGVVEAQDRDRDLFGRQRLVELLQERVGSPAGQIQEAILGALEQFVGEEAPSDDVTIVVLCRELPVGEEKLRAAEPRPRLDETRPLA